MSMEPTALDALVRWSANLCALGLEREAITIEVGENLFVSLIRDGGGSWLFSQPDGSRPIRRFVYGHRAPEFGAVAVAQCVNPHRADYVDLSRTAIRDGIKIRMYGPTWTVRLNPVDRARLLLEVEKLNE